MYTKVMDSMEALLGKNDSIIEPSDYNFRISFIAASTNVDEKVENSIYSISRIAEELGRDFEIILTTPFKSTLKSMARILLMRENCSQFQLNVEDFSSPGRGKQISFEKSSGKYVVPFNPEVSYPVEFSDILHSFLKFKLKRLFYSELPLISSEIVKEVGGWRDLLIGEDLDLFARISMNYGTLAMPSDLMPGTGYGIEDTICLSRIFTFNSLPYKRKMEYVRDLIISCNLSFRETNNISSLLSEYEGFRIRGISALAQIMKHFYPVKPVNYDRNNLTVFMESVLESLVLKEFQRLGDVSSHVHLNIHRVLLKFLQKNSNLYREMSNSLSLYVTPEY